MGLDAPSLAVAALGFGCRARIPPARIGPHVFRRGARRRPAEQGLGLPVRGHSASHIVGKLVGFAGLALHAPFRAAWWPLLLGHVVAYVIVLCQEVANCTWETTYRFEATYRDFVRFHQRTGNVAATSSPRGSACSASWPRRRWGARARHDAGGGGVVRCGPLRARLRGHDTRSDRADVDFSLRRRAGRLPRPSGAELARLLGLLVFGTVAQELSHLAFRERTYMSSYQRERGAWPGSSCCTACCSCPSSVGRRSSGPLTAPSQPPSAVMQRRAA